MRAAWGLTMVILVAGAAGAVAGQTKGDPDRRPGLWTMKLTYDDGAYKIPDSTMCLDAKSDRRTTLVGAQMRRSRCSEYSVARQADGSWSVRTVCVLNGGEKSVTTGRVTGDLASAYDVVAESETTGAKWSSENGRHAIRISARWTGPCLAGQRGGDVTVNGRTSNVFSSR